jgi:uncharacterized sulfatase
MVKRVLVTLIAAAAAVGLLMLTMIVGDVEQPATSDRSEQALPDRAPPAFGHKFRGQQLYRPPTFMADLSDKPKLQQAMQAAIIEQLGGTDRLPGYYYAYYACNSYVDSEIGRVIAAAEQHMPEGTLIVFTSDHGDHLGAFGLTSKGPTMYDSCTAVPLIVHRVGSARRGVIEEGLISHTDVVQTMLDYAGADPVAESGGQSFASVFDERNAGFRGRDAVFIEYHRFSQRHSHRGGFYPIRSVRTHRWKLNINLLDRDELYDLEADPHEATNLIDAAEHAAVRNDLHDRIIAETEVRRDLVAGDGWKVRPWRADKAWQVEQVFPSGTPDEWDRDHLGNSQEGAL